MPMFRRDLPLGLGLGAALLLLAGGCGHSRESQSPGNHTARDEAGKTAGIRVIRPEKRDIKMLVVQPGTIEAFEATPVYSRIAGYVERYNYNIGDRVKPGDVLLQMWIPDYVEEREQKSAAVQRAEVQIRVAESAARAAAAKLETTRARVDSAEAGVKRAQASLARWESEYKRQVTLVNNRVLDVQVRDETFRQYEESLAARDQAEAMVAEAKSARDQAEADLERARVDIEAARADLAVAQANERQARVLVDYGHIKAPYPGVITQRNVSPGDYLQPGGGGGGNSRPVFVLEQVDPVRIFVGVPERASFFVHEGDTALIRFQALAGITREGKVVRSGFSLNPTTRTLQTEIDVPNANGSLHPGWYVTVTIVIERNQVWAVPSDAVSFQGGQNYSMYLDQDGKPVPTPVIVGASDDVYTEILRKAPQKALANTYDWPMIDGSERIFAGNLDVLEAQATATKLEPKPKS
jgi:multidrug efflux pump subunit AcrA (membrane-fusion protein)